MEKGFKVLSKFVSSKWIVQNLRAKSITQAAQKMLYRECVVNVASNQAQDACCVWSSCCQFLSNQICHAKHVSESYLVFSCSRLRRNGRKNRLIRPDPGALKCRRLNRLRALLRPARFEPTALDVTHKRPRPLCLNLSLAEELCQPYEPIPRTFGLIILGFCCFVFRFNLIARVLVSLNQMCIPWYLDSLS